MKALQSAYIIINVMSQMAETSLSPKLLNVLSTTFSYLIYTCICTHLHLHQTQMHDPVVNVRKSSTKSSFINSISTILNVFKTLFQRTIGPCFIVPRTGELPFFLKFSHPTIVWSWLGQTVTCNNNSSGHLLCTCGLLSPRSSGPPSWYR